MQNITDAGRFADYPPQVVLQAVLATNLTSFTEFAFGVVRPDISFKPNWHFEAVTHKLSEVASGEPEIAVRLGGFAGLVSRP